jgi:hypothetical protein
MENLNLLRREFMTEPIVLDNTKRSTYRQCKAKYNFSANHGLQSSFGSTAIRYGVCWHGIQEGYHSWIKENGWPTDAASLMSALSAGLELGKKKFDKESEVKLFNDDYKNYNTAVNAFNAYLDFFADDKNYLKVISTETKFECPIEPENEAEERLLKLLPPVIFTGRIDLCVEMDFMKWLFDFKTTGWILDQVISKANRSPQLIGYSYAGEKVLDFKPAGCLCSFAYIGASKSKTTGEYGNVRYDFRRVPQVYTQGDIDAWKISFIDTCREIYFSQQNNLWPESFDNCFQYGSCPYLRLCQQHVPFEDLNTEGFIVQFWDVLESEEA